MNWAVAAGPILMLCVVGLGAIVTLVLLLSNPKTRKGAVLLLAFSIPLTALMIPLAAVLHFRVPNVRISQIGTPVPEITAPSEPNSEPEAEADVAENSETANAQEDASKTKEIVRAIVRAVTQAIAEARKAPTTKKDEPGVTAGSPSSANDTVGQANRGTHRNDSKSPTLTLTLSQGEREPNKATVRPAWVDAPPQVVGDAYQMSITVGPYTTRAECDAKLPDALQEALGRYVEACLADQTTDGIQLPADYLRQQLVKAQWEETRQYSVGPMTQLHVLLQFDRKVKDRILEEHRQWIVNQRLQIVSQWAAMGLGLLAVCFGYLKIDLATGGVYRGRLRLAAAAAILGLVAVAVVVVG